MPLNRQDCVELIRDVERLLREYDPSALDLVIRATEQRDDPRQYLVLHLGTIARVYSERSGGTYGSILDRINHFVRLENGSPVRGLSVVLSPGEREVYETDELNLAQLPDRSEFVQDIIRIIDEVKREIESPG